MYRLSSMFLTVLLLVCSATQVEAARRPSRVPVRSSVSSSSSSSVKTTVRPSRRTLINGTSSSSAAAKATSTYPINLLTNQEWTIRVTGPEDYTGGQPVLTVSRKGESFSANEQTRNLKTGKLEKSPSDWKAEYTTDYYARDNVYLQLYHCWYKYENIRAGFSCEYHRIPVKIDQAAVKGDWDFDGLLEGVYDDYTVDIISKSSKDVVCNVKAETTDDGSKIYYTKDSTFFTQVSSGFQCFDSEDGAKKAGYKQSYR